MVACSLACMHAWAGGDEDSSYSHVMYMYIILKKDIEGHNYIAMNCCVLVCGVFDKIFDRIYSYNIIAIAITKKICFHKLTIYSLSQSHSLTYYRLFHCLQLYSPAKTCYT